MAIAIIVSLGVSQKLQILSYYAETTPMFAFFLELRKHNIGYPFDFEIGFVFGIRSTRCTADLFSLDFPKGYFWPQKL